MKPNSNIILIDSTISHEKIEKIIDSINEHKIITFDYVAHKILSSKNILHSISDDFITTNEIKSIQNNAYDLSQWSVNPKFSTYLDYKNVNLGNLFYIEFFVFILPIIKKIFEIKKISESYPNVQYFSSGTLYEIIKLFSNNVEKISIVSSTSDFIYDNVKLENNLLGTQISSEHYTKLKNLSEKFTDKFFGLDNNSSNNGILLTEFNTIRYNKLFLALKNSNTIFYGIRRPAIWNFKSYSIIKNSDISIATLNKILTSNVKEQINNDIKEKSSTFDILFEQNSLFESFFSINNTSFWKIVKPFLKNLCYKRLKDSITNVIASEILLRKLKPKHVLLLSESGPTEQILLKKSKELGISTILFYHGMVHDTPDGHKWNAFSGSVSINSDKFFVWGEAMKRYANEYGIPENKITVVGSPAHDSFFDAKNNLNKSSDYILLVAQGPGINLHTNDYLVKSHIEYENTLKSICQIVKKQGKKLIIKLHAYEEDTNEDRIVKSIDEDVRIIKKGDMISLINSSSAVILLGTSLSTAILEAHILQKPVLRLKFGDWMGKPDQLRVTSCFQISIEDFEDNLMKLYNDENFKQQILSQGQKFLADYLSYPGNSSNTIKDILEK